MTARAEMVAGVAARVPVPADSPVRVAIDGVTGAGKTTFRGELADALRSLGRNVTEASGDDFHHRREHRYRQGRGSARGYYEDAYDYHALGDKLLRPLGPDGNRKVRLRHHDLETDAILVDEPVIKLSRDTILVVDGSFLQRPELGGLWDFIVLLEATREVSARRQMIRDGAPGDPSAPCHARYFGGYDAYVAARHPRAGADVIVNNDDADAPTIIAEDS